MVPAGAAKTLSGYLGADQMIATSEQDLLRTASLRETSCFLWSGGERMKGGRGRDGEGETDERERKKDVG